ncbi:hypothetical protein T11_11341 [Trichinella zimbabwensis]|uniref:Uncharacterized protein n=1 Tax=Trichinella zimbabwensis TaxID=268475 RepID=A0A0V1GWI4_9BILA|nr:hypothetical protein T11_11341 [Trichinella zimbabwensis]
MMTWLRMEFCVYQTKASRSRTTFRYRKYNLCNNFDVFLCCAVLEILSNLDKVKVELMKCEILQLFTVEIF